MLCCGAHTHRETPQPYLWLDTRCNCLQTALSICLLCLTLEVTDLTLRSNLWIFTYSWHPLMGKRLCVQSVHFRAKSSGGLWYCWCQEQHQHTGLILFGWMVERCVWVGHILEDQHHLRSFRKDQATHSLPGAVSSSNFLTSWRERRLSDICARQHWEWPWKC